MTIDSREVLIQNAITVLHHTILKIRASAISDPQAVYNLADAIHNIPFALLETEGTWLESSVSSAKKTLDDFCNKNSAMERSKARYVNYRWKPLEPEFEQGRQLLEVKLNGTTKSTISFAQMSFLLSQLSIDQKPTKHEFNDESEILVMTWVFIPQNVAPVQQALYCNKDWLDMTYADKKE
jgi:hypothetical protein